MAAQGLLYVLMVPLTDSDGGPDIYSASYMYFYPIITFPGP